MNPARNPVALVVGAGDATGGAIARRFARAGMTAVVVRRSASALEPLVAQIEAEGGRAVAVPAKHAYTGKDLGRFAARHGVPMAFNPHFPINTTVLMRLATALRDDPGHARYVDFAFDAMWHFPRNMGKADEVTAMLTNAGFDAAAILAKAETQAVKDALRATTDDAITRGVFGAPTFFVDGEMWFGQDRLDWVEAAAA